MANLKQATPGNMPVGKPKSAKSPKNYPYKDSKSAPVHLKDGHREGSHSYDSRSMPVQPVRIGFEPARSDLPQIVKNEHNRG